MHNTSLLPSPLRGKRGRGLDKRVSGAARIAVQLRELSNQMHGKKIHDHASTLKMQLIVHGLTSDSAERSRGQGHKTEHKDVGERSEQVRQTTIASLLVAHCSRSLSSLLFDTLLS